MDKNDLKTAFQALQKKQLPYKTLMNYYEGKQPLRYTDERLEEVFGTSMVKFVQNWCSVVIDASLDRLVFKGWDIENKADDGAVDAFYQAHNIQQKSKDVHKDALVASEGFILFDTVDDVLTPFRNDPRAVAVFYQDDDPGKMRFACKWWKDTKEKKTRLNLYYPDRIEKYVGNEDPQTESAFKIEKELTNQYGEIPVVRFEGSAEILNIMSLQDAVNKTFSDMMVVGEFNAFQQRYMITNAEMGALKNNPKTILAIPKGAPDEEDTKVGSFPAADLTKFLETMDKLANSIAIITRTPKHYFHDTGGNISGDALVVMESPLIKKVVQYQEQFSIGWRQVAAFMLRQTGMAVNQSEIMTIWDGAETIQPESEAREIQMLNNAGIPLTTILRRKGWGKDEIDQFLADMEDEKKRRANLASSVLDYVREQDRQDNRVV